MKIGYIGLGTMGSPMVGHLIAAGHSLIVNDVNKAAAEPHLARGAVWATTPAEIARGAEIVFTSVPGPAEMEKIVFGANGLLEGAHAGLIHLDLTTNSLAMVKRIHAAMAEKGASMLDAPVSGGPTGAHAATLALWIGGDRSAFDKAKPVIDVIGNQARYVGDIGAGTIAKLVHNCGGYVLHAMIAEVFSLGMKAGLDPVTLWEAIRDGSYNRIGTFDWATRKFLGGEVDDVGFALKLAHKDVTLAVNMARELKVPMRLSQLALEELTEAMNRGWENRDARSMMLLQLERARVEMKIDRERYEALKKQFKL